MAMLIEVRIGGESDGNLIVKASKNYLYFKVAFDLDTCIFRLVLELIRDVLIIQCLVFLIWLVDNLHVLVLVALQLLLI